MPRQRAARSHPARAPKRAGKSDSIRIVPLHVPAGTFAPRPEIAAPPSPRLTYRGGPLMSAVRVFTVFWGRAWSEPANSALIARLNAFFTAIVQSALIDQLAEYSVPAWPIGHGSYLGTRVVTAPELGSNVTDTDIREMLEREIAAKVPLPPPDPNLLYFLYLPPGVSVTAGSDRSCQAFCGYHDAIDGRTFYAVMPYPGCRGCTGDLAVLDALTSTSSHELCEAITDPIPGQGWYDDDHGEIADVCAWQTKRLGDYLVQLEWSNAQGGCR
jgi:hypothetical protein